MKSIIRNSAPHVEALIEQATEGGLSGALTVEKVRHWRLTSTNLLSALSLVYNAWMRSLVLESADVISDLVSRVCGYDRRSQQAQWVRNVVEAWCDAQCMFPENYSIPANVRSDQELPAFGQFIVNFGVKYKIRRISMILQHVNIVYRMVYEEGGENPGEGAVDQVKRAVSECLKPLLALSDPAFLAKFEAGPIRALFCVPKEAPMPDAARYARNNIADITQVIAAIGEVCGLVGTNEELDAVLGSPLMAAMNPACRRTILNGYLGWPYWDVVMLPVMNALGLDSNAFEEVLVDRISPNDARTVCTDDGCGELHGEAVIGFGGFLSQGARENDYLWGRIHGIDRLIDLVASAIDPLQGDEFPDIGALKKRAFEAMLQQETDRLSTIPKVLEAVSAAVSKL